MTTTRFPGSKPAGVTKNATDTTAGVDANRLQATPSGDAKAEVSPEQSKVDAFERVQTQGVATAIDTATDTAALLRKFGLESGAEVQGATPTQGAKLPLHRRFAQNLRNFVGGLVEREKKLVQHTFSAMKSFGLAALHCTSKNDIVQLHDFAKLAIENGQPLEVFGILQEVAGFIWKYPEEARNIMRFLDKAEKETFKQQSAWMNAGAPVGAAGAGAVGQLPPKGPPREADVVVIGGGLSAGHIVRNLADAFKSGSTSQKVMVLEKDSQVSREHQASLRNAGIVSTAMDYIFDLDEAIGKKPVDRIAKALGISEAEAKVAYRSMHKVMAEATDVIKDFLKAKGAKFDDIELRPAGGLDIVHTEEELDKLRALVKQARALGLDWEAIDKKVLAERHHIENPEIAGALEMRDSAIIHPGKLVKALFDYATANSKDINVQYDTEVLHAKPDEKGDGWILVTNQGEIHAKNVIDAREAYAPYRFREARFSQIHVLDVGEQGKPMTLGETNVCHSLTYMRKIGAGKFLVGSGDFPLRDPNETPRPMASVALYAAAHFKKLYPDTPYNIEKVWGGVFGLSTDGLPVSGELLRGWHVVGGAGGSGLNITPATSKQVVDNILGKPQEGPLQPVLDFSPRRFFTRELRDDLLKSMHQFAAFHDLPLEKLKLVIGKVDQPPVRSADEVVFTVTEKTLDAMNTDAAVLFGPKGPEEVKKREQAKAEWVREQLDAVRQRLLPGRAAPPLLAPAQT